MQLSHPLPAQSFQIPTLLQSVQRLALNDQRVSVPRKVSGLSLLDIDDASQRATAKNGLKARPNPNQALRSV